MTVAKSYRMLKAILATAVEDEIIRRNPCRIPRKHGSRTHPCRFHDLRHTGNTLAARTGATLRDLMHRMGRLERAAMIYQHADERDSAIADALDGLLGADSDQAGRSGTDSDWGSYRERKGARGAIRTL